MRNKIFIGWCIFHLVFILLINAVGSYNSYCDFYDKPKINVAAQKLLQMYNQPFFKYYGRYTGAESGYGFFGINVRSNGMLIGECNGEKLVPDFKTDNASLRFFSLSNAITEGLLKNKKILPADTGKRDILSEYNDLVLKNIAVTLYQKNNCSDTSITLSYNLLDFPSLSEVRKGATKKYQLIKMQTLQYSLQQK